MAVYTRIDQQQVKAFLRACDLGEYISHDGITQGVENTNYLLTTTNGRFILTLVEKRTAPQDLPFIFSYMQHLAAKGMRVPNVLAQGVIADKPAAVISFLDGHSIEEVTPAHCAQIGATLAQMHKAAESFTGTRDNPVGPAEWQRLFDAVEAKIEPALAATIENALTACACADWKKLPRGAVHADLFRDNVFFKDDRLSGVIDFYFACTTAYAYDLAITVNAWCFDAGNRAIPECVQTMLDAYQAIRPLNADERAAFESLRKAGALRILMTRLYDWVFTPADAQVTKKDPMEYLVKLQSDYQWL